MAASEFTGLSSIGQIAQVVKDIPKATAWYRDVLGMRFLFSAGSLAFFDCDGIRLMLSTAEKPEFDHPGSILYFRVPEIQAAARTLESRGIRLLEKPHLVASMKDHDLWIAFFRDPDGNPIALMSEVPKK